MVMYYSSQQKKAECCKCGVKASMFKNVYLVEEEGFAGYCWDHLPAKYKKN